MLRSTLPNDENHCFLRSRPLGHIRKPLSSEYFIRSGDEAGPAGNSTVMYKMEGIITRVPQNLPLFRRSYLFLPHGLDRGNRFPDAYLRDYKPKRE